MGVRSMLKKTLLKNARMSYNDSNYSQSLRYSKFSQFIFKDKESLDIQARSQLRLKKYDHASKSYELANKRGLNLLDHSENHFKSEILATNYISAFKIMKKSLPNLENKRTTQLIKGLNNLTDSERVNIIEKMADFAPLPSKISELLPWAPKDFSYSKSTSKQYILPTKHDIEMDRMKRELNRVKNSSSYAVSKYFSKTIRHPYEIIKMPFTFPRLILQIYHQKRGIISSNEEFSFQIQGNDDFRDCIVLFPTNGVGFGHFTRLLAVAKSFRELNPSTEIVFFTTMPTLQILSENGFIGYHIPGRYRYNDMEPSVWNSVCEEMLNFIFSIHRPKAFIFDGAYPYRGMLNALDSKNANTLKAWLRRGTFKSDSKNIPIESIGKFNAIIRPGDSGIQDFEDELKHNATIVKTNPILIHDSTTQSYENIRERLGVPEYATLCYLQLGAGKINDINSEISMTLDSLEQYPHIYTIVGESMLGDRISYNSEKVRILRDYPNSKYFNQFDFAIIAGGYNSYHEVIESTLPSICYPNLSTGRDDQLSRVSIASEVGAMIVLKIRTKGDIDRAILRISDSKVREEMARKISSLRKPNGSKEAANWILEQISI